LGRAIWPHGIVAVRGDVDIKPAADDETMPLPEPDND